MTVLHLIWLDSESECEWTPIEALSETLDLTHSVGLLIKETEDFVLLALSFDPGTESVNNFKKIPRSAIKERRTLCHLNLKKTSS